MIDYNQTKQVKKRDCMKIDNQQQDKLLEQRNQAKSQKCK